VRIENKTKEDLSGVARSSSLHLDAVEGSDCLGNELRDSICIVELLFMFLNKEAESVVIDEN
jgi:hypothetical protein